MIEEQYEFRILKDKDIDTYKSDFDKVDKIKLDLKKNKLHPIKFVELFDRLSRTKMSYFQLDMSNTSDLDDDKLDAIVKCIRVWNLKSLILLFSNVKLTDTQFESLIFESIQTMTNLENLYLDLENIDFDENKLHTLERLIPKLKNLQKIFLNIKRNKITRNEIERLGKNLKHISSQELIFE
jgi:hypothetical protein